MADISVRFVANSEAYESGVNAVIKSTDMARQAIKDFGAGALDAEGLVRLLANTGNKDISDLAQVLIAAGVPVKELTASLTAANQGIRQSALDARHALEEQRKAAEETKTKIYELAEASRQFNDLVEPLKRVAEGAVDGAEKIEALHRAIAVMSSSSVEAEERIGSVKQVFEKMGGAVPIEQLYQGAAALAKWHQPAELLDDVAILAARAKLPVGELAESIGKGGEGSVRALRAIGDAVGLTKEQLQAMVGATTGGNKSLEELANQGDKVKEIFHQLAEKYANAGSATTTFEAAQNQLHASLLEAEQAMGEALVPVLQQVTLLVKDAVDEWNSLSPELKTATGYAVGAASAFAGLAGGLASVGVAVGGAATLLNTLGVGISLVGTSAATAGISVAAFGTTATATFAGMAAAAAPVAGIIIGIAWAVNKLSQEINDYEASQKALESQLTRTSQEQAKFAAAMHGDWIHKGAEELHGMGVTSRDVAEALAGLRDQVNAVRASTTLSADAKAVLISRLQAESDALRTTAQSLKTYENALTAAEQAQRNLKETLEQTRGQYAAGMTDLQSVISAQEAVAKSLEGNSDKTKEWHQALTQLHALQKQQINEAVEGLRLQYQQGKLTYEELQSGLDAQQKKLATIPGLQLDAMKMEADLQRERNRQADEDAALARQREEERARNMEASHRRAREVELADAESARQSAVQAAQEELNRAKAALDEKKRLGTDTIADQQRVTDAVTALAKAEGDAKVQAAQNAVEKAKLANEDTTQAEHNLERVQTEVQHNMTQVTTQEARRRADEEVASADRSLDHQLKNLQILADQGKLTTEDYIKRLQDISNTPGISQQKKQEVDTQTAEKQKELRSHQIEQERSLAQIQQERSKAEEDALRRRFESGENVVDQLIAKINTRYETERQQIIATAEEEERKFGKSAESQALLQEKLAKTDANHKNELDGVAGKELSYLRSVGEELDKLLKKKDALSGSPFKGPQGLKDAFNDFGLGKGGLFGPEQQGEGADFLSKLPPGVDPSQLQQMLAFTKDKLASPNDPRIAQLYGMLTGSNGTAVTSSSTSSTAGPGSPTSPVTTAGFSSSPAAVDKGAYGAPDTSKPPTAPAQSFDALLKYVSSIDQNVAKLAGGKQSNGEAQAPSGGTKSTGLDFGSSVGNSIFSDSQATEDIRYSV